MTFAALASTSVTLAGIVTSLHHSHAPAQSLNVKRASPASLLSSRLKIPARPTVCGQLRQWGPDLSEPVNLTAKVENEEIGDCYLKQMAGSGFQISP